MPRPKRTKAPAAQSSAIEALKKRKEAAALAAAAPAPVPPTPQQQRAPPSAIKAQSTPGPANETSVLALANFKRRPRQPSILRMVQQSDNAAPEDDDTIDTLDDSLDTLGGLDDTLANFNPEDESTPVHKKRTTRLSGATGEEPRTSSSRKRKFVDPEPEMETELEVEAEEEIQVPRSSPPVIELSHQEREERDDSSDHLYSEASDLPTTQVPRTQEEPATAQEDENEENGTENTARAPSTEDIWSATMAPPMSSSSIPDHPTHSSDPTPTTTSKRPRRRQPTRGQQNKPSSISPAASDISDYSAATRKPATKTKSTRQQALTTATLQSLLPRRRPTRAKKHHDVFDIPSSDSAAAMAGPSDDEDELQHPPTSRKTAAARRTMAASKPPTAATAKRKGAQGKGGKAAAAAAGKSKSVTKTYSRRLSDKENRADEEDGDGVEEDDSTEVTTTRKAIKKSAELAAMAKKFAEVDNWDLEFESVDMGGQSASSPWR
ncbi:hypothetical protein K490DRAFT_52647 [Saccharata proteae CBS 121410]|uniref:Uncharacterized protein n=1 Tax=Saccharata proteae CBS 121410 TaxID=1314787 RepID=A0A9P4HY88_9PEZI|nr:hypothetical protein K490DRAFT_52647 [Saccharata proteae CBS 121410]